MTDDLYDQTARTTCRVWPDDAPERKSLHYGDAEFLDQQLRLLDLVPRRFVALMFLFSGGAAAAVGLEFLYGWMVARMGDGGTAIAALDLGSRGSLACWFSSLLLLSASVAALLVYSVRRHRTDDYQGRYRVWIWAAGGCFLLAAEQATGLREAFRELMIFLTGTSLLGGGDLWWIIAYGIIFGAIGSRVLIDLRRCVPAVAALSAASVAFGLVVAQRFGWGFFVGGTSQVMYLAGCEMAGSVLLSAAFAFYARYVILDAEGLLPRRRNDASEDCSSDENNFQSTGPGRWRKIDPPHATPQPAYRQAPKIAPASSTAAIAAPASVTRKLTKAEKKALRKRLLQQRLERERKCG